MALKVGIVGLPNVGKSTLFNALTKAHVEAANYPFATIKPNTGIVIVPDDRVNELSRRFKPERTINATIEFYDIAGLVRGASKGEGLGNQFLANIRECDAIVEVVRCFDSGEIVHVENNVDPARDVDIINLELVIADLEVLERRHKKVATKARVEKEVSSVFENNLIERLIKHLSLGRSARTLPNVTLAELEFMRKQLFLLTAKPIIYVANISEEDYANPEASRYYQILTDIAKNEKAEVIPVSAQIESELIDLSDEDRDEYLESLGANESGLDKVARAAYHILNLATFFTVGADEVRAWTFNNGQTAQQCAGIIHTDFARGFIKAEIYQYGDLLKHQTELAVKEAGKLRIEGRDYLMKDGDIVHFRFNV